MNAPFRVALLLGHVLAAVLLAAGPTWLPAQPSGGPYGPVQRRYEIPAGRRVVFVAPDGSPDASGQTIGTPTSLEAAIARVSSGDVIVLRGGIYRTGDLRLNQGVTLQPYEDERPVLKGTEVASRWEALPGKRWRTHWEHLFPATPADWWQPARHVKETPLHLFNNDMVFVDGELLGAVGRAEDVGEKTYFIDYERGEVTIGADPQNRLVEITAHDSGLVRTFREVHGRQNDHRGPVIRGLTFTQYAYRALEVEGVEPQKHSDPATFGKEVVGTVLEDLVISFCSRVAGYFRGDKLVIRRCLVSDCGTEGIYVINSGDILLEKNIVTRTNSAERFTGYYVSAVKIFNQSYRAVVRDNLVIDNPYASGVWYDVGEVDGVFVNNWVERTNDGFFYEISKDAVCAGNVFVDCHPGVKALNSSNVQVYQNTFYNSSATFRRDDRSAANDHFGWHPSAGPDVSERQGHGFVNNLMIADDSMHGELLEFWQGAKVRDRLKEPQVSALDGNVYVRRTVTSRQPVIVWSPVRSEKGSQDVFALSELRSINPAFEANSRLLNEYWGPLVRGLETGRFELDPRFPGADAGVPLPATIRTKLGWETRGPSFPGAYKPAVRSE